MSRGPWLTAAFKAEVRRHWQAGLFTWSSPSAAAWRE